MLYRVCSISSPYRVLSYEHTTDYFPFSLILGCPHLGVVVPVSLPHREGVPGGTCLQVQLMCDCRQGSEGWRLEGIGKHSVWHLEFKGLVLTGWLTGLLLSSEKSPGNGFSLLGRAEGLGVSLCPWLAQCWSSVVLRRQLVFLPWILGWTRCC